MTNAHDRPSLLMVDDDPAKLLVLRTVLADMDVEMVETRSGAEALSRLLHRDFAVILLDVSMPGMDGFETAQLIRQRARSQATPIIFVTSIATADVHVARGYSLGAVDYILTPIVPDTLRAKVRVFVTLYQQSEQLRRQGIALETANAFLQQQLKEVERLNVELQLAYTDLESFSYSVSHDLRAPLRHIQGFAQLLQASSESRLDEKSEGYLQQVISSCEHMESLIQDLLKLSRISRRPFSLEEVNLSELAAAIALELQQSEPERQVAFDIQEGLMVQADSGLLRIAIDNLIGNAWKYSNRQPESRIEVRRADLLGKEAFLVRDNGVGFDQSQAPRVFAPFVRLHPAGEFAGTGIGLATVYRIIRRHGGRIWAEAAEGKGATFFFTLS